MSVLEIEVKAPTMIRVDDNDYRLSFPLRAVAELEETLGRGLKFVSDWLNIKTHEIRSFLYFGLITHQDEDVAARVADAIAERLDPEGIEHVINALCMASFPKAMERVAKEIEKAHARQREGKAAFPNAESGAVS